jgi:putative transposase
MWRRSQYTSHDLQSFLKSPSLVRGMSRFRKLSRQREIRQFFPDIETQTDEGGRSMELGKKPVLMFLITSKCFITVDVGMALAS